MDLTPVSQKEFIERYNSGERIFSNIFMQFVDISGTNFDGLILKGSKLMFCTFWDCRMKNVRFENCDIYFGSFYTGEISETVFEKCKIEMTLFDNILFDKTKLQRCHVRFSGILNSNAVSVDVSSSTGRIITDISQITAQDMEDSVSEVLESI